MKGRGALRSEGPHRDYFASFFFSELVLANGRIIISGSIPLYMCSNDMDRDRDLFIVWIKLFQFIFKIRSHRISTIKIILLGNFDVLDIKFERKKDS